MSITIPLDPRLLVVTVLGSFAGLLVAMTLCSFALVEIERHVALSPLAKHAIIASSSVVLVALWFLVLAWLSPILAPTVAPCGAPDAPSCITL